jgi:polyhydroxyalkanoate synthesis regulator protein
METNTVLQIKRYNNRKLYSLESSSYITSSELVKSVLGGRQVRVTSKDGADVTNQILAQAFVVFLASKTDVEKAAVVTNVITKALRDLDVLFGVKNETI